MSLEEISTGHFKNQIFSAPNEVCGERYLSGPMFGLFSFINISCGREEVDDARCCRRNMVEVAVTVKIVDKLYKAWIHGSGKTLSISIVSPYASQVCAIQEKLGHKYVNDDIFTVRVRAVDGFEIGISEEDVVILSTVRSNNHGSIDSISMDQWTDASRTRARPSLWILGNEEALVNSGSELESVLHNAKEQKCFFNAEEDEDLAKLLAEVKRELHEFDALLSADCKLFKNAKWKVMFSDDFRKSFVNLKSPHTKRLLTNLLLRLSCGWRPKRRNVDITCDRSKQILKQFKVKDLYVICSVDIKKESVYVQVLKVWDILPLFNVSNLVTRLDGIFTTYHNDYLNRCKMKCFKGDLEVPMTWESSSNIVRLKNNSNIDDALDWRNYLEDSGVNESLSLMKFYSLSSGTAMHLLSGCDGKELGVPFELNDEETDIIMFDKSSFILGRSGTGKTTVLIMKIIQREQLYHLAYEGFHEVGNNSSMDSDEEIEEAILRQIFVTVSPKLCYAVKHNISQFQRFTCNGHSTEETISIDMEDIDEAAQFRDIPDSFVSLPSISYPLIITFHKFVMMLDGTLGRSYFDKFPEVRKFSQGENRRSVMFQTFIRVKEVNYEKFHSSYWPRFNQQLIKKFDSLVVFTEIISRIKGVVGQKRAFDSPLELDEYLLMCKGQVSSLSEVDKQRVYEIFLQYEKRKRELGEFDFGDLVMDLHKRFQDEKYNGDKIEFVYVDEVQDLNTRQIALFKYVCRNFHNGFVFSGDTAQTIAKGVAFRFQDIGALFYEDFTSDSRSHASGTNVKTEKGQTAEFFHLRQNFRTHCGVLKLSQSILDLIYDFFPSSIDFLSPETSLVFGNAPVWLEPVNNEESLEPIFLKLSSSGRNMVGFGAEQVILVRDEHEKSQVLNIVGKKALVLTIFECKGLEFQDVLLYNFFTSSPLENQWRVVYEYMKRKNLLDSSSMAFPRLTDGKDILLCSELKQLYVAITRTRQRLWIFENAKDLTRPVFDYWSKLCLVQVKPLDHLQDKKVESTKEEWKSQGIKLFHQHNYEMAQMCFEKAGDAYMEKWAEAASLRGKADRTTDSDPYISRNYRKTAAQMFDSIGKFELAAQCYIELNEYQIAGKIYKEKFGESRLEDAGDCFVRAKCYESAACAFAKANLFSKCLSACSNGKMLDMGLEYIENWRQSSSDCDFGKRINETENFAQAFLENAAHYYNRIEDYTTMMKFVKAFDSKKSMHTFLMGLNHLNEILILEQQWGCFAEAADIAKLKGDVLLEVDLLEKAEKFEDAAVLILNYVLCNSLFKPGSEGWPMKQYQNKNDLLTKAKVLAKNVSDSFYQLVETEANVLSDKWNGLFEMNKCLRDSQMLRSVKGEILSARQILDAHFDLEITEDKWEYTEVFNLTEYVSKRLSKNKLTVETLIYFWDLWKHEMERVVECLKDCEDEEDVYAEFCLGYFGVRRFRKDRLIMIYPDAQWGRVIGWRVFKKKGNVVTIDKRSFARAAQSYWSSELLSVGMKVIEVLKALVEFSFSSTGSISRYSSSKTLAYGFKVTQFVMSSKFLHPSYDHISMLRRFSDRCVSTFFDSTFSIDCWKSMTESMIPFRESEPCKNLLEEVINKNIKASELTYRKIGVVVTALVGARYMKDKVYGMISASFTWFPHWEEWIETYIESKEWEDSESSDDLPLGVSLVSKFYRALQVSSRDDWGAKFMSPATILYLLERLFVMVCHAYFDNCFFMTRATFVEWLISEKWCPGKSFTVQDDRAQILDDALHFLFVVVQDILCCKIYTKEWVEEFYTDVEYVYQQLVLRLVVLTCVLCVNTQSKDHSNFVFNLLNSEEIATKLPQQFYATLQRWERDQVDTNVRILVDACGKIGNPVVMVNARRNWPNFLLPGAKFIDLQEKRGRGFMLRKLFS